MSRTLYIAVGVALTLSVISVANQYEHNRDHEMIAAWMTATMQSCTRAGVDVQPLPGGTK